MNTKYDTEGQIGHKGQLQKIEEHRALEKHLGALRSETDSSEKWRLERKMETLKAAVIKANMFLVYQLAKKIRPKNIVPVEDLVSIGKEALVQSFNDYDTRYFDDPVQPKNFYEFSSYNVKSRISSAMGKAGCPRKYPIALLETVRKVYRMIEQFEVEAGHKLTLDELAPKFKYTSRETLEGLARLAIVPISLSAGGKDKEGEKHALYHVLVDNQSPDPQRQANISSFREALPKISHILSDIEKIVIALLYGIKDLYALEICKIAHDYPRVMARIKKIQREVSMDIGRETPELIPALNDFFGQSIKAACKPSGDDLRALGLLI